MANILPQMLYTQLINIDNPLRLSKPANEGQQGITVVSNCTRASFVHIMKRNIVIKCSLKRGTLITKLLITISQLFTHRTPPTNFLYMTRGTQRERCHARCLARLHKRNGARNE